MYFCNLSLYVYLSMYELKTHFQLKTPCRDETCRFQLRKSASYISTWDGKCVFYSHIYEFTRYAIIAVNWYPAGLVVEDILEQNSPPPVDRDDDSDGSPQSAATASDDDEFVDFKDTTE